VTLGRPIGLPRIVCSHRTQLFQHNCEGGLDIILADREWRLRKLRELRRVEHLCPERFRH
jgi:hypothetical protein